MQYRRRYAVSRIEVSMSVRYRYTALTLAHGRERIGELAEHLRTRGLEALRAAGGELYGLWSGQLGFASDEAVLITSWPDAERAARAEGAALAGCEAVHRLECVTLEPTVRPQAPSPPAGAGVFVFRWFEVAPDDVDAFVRLSSEAWQTFEARFDAAIQGLFLDRGAGAPPTRLLLLTRYGSYADWEASRSVRSDPDAWQRFARRHELTRRTIGRAAGLVEL